MNKKQIICLILCLCVTIMSGCTTKFSRYKEALEYFNSGKYDEAYDIFVDLGDYKDSKKYVGNEFSYRKAVKKLNEGDYSSASYEFRKLAEKGYRDSEELYSRVLKLEEEEEERERERKKNMHYDEYTGEWYPIIDTETLTIDEAEDLFSDDPAAFADWLDSHAGISVDDWELMKEYGDDWINYSENN